MTLWRVIIGDSKNLLFDSDVEASRPELAVIEALAQVASRNAAVFGTLSCEAEPVVR